MKEYVVAGIYLLVITILWHTYYYTFYTILDNYLVIKWGFIKLKIKYERIKEIKKETKYCVIEFKRFKLHINPENEDEFVKEIKKKVQ